MTDERVSVAIYARYSTDRQDARSIDDQRKLSRAIFAALHELLASHDFRQRFADRFARRVAARKPADAEERSRLKADVDAQEARLRRVTEAFATVGQSEALVAQLRREEARLRDVQNRLAAAEESTKPAPTAITVNPEKLAKYLRHIEKLAEEAPGSARTALARVLAPVMLHPVEKDGKRSYEARGALKIKDPVSLSGDRVLDKVGCGGPQHGLQQSSRPVFTGLIERHRAALAFL